MALAVTPLNVPNNTRNFYPVNRGDWELKVLPTAASLAAVDGTAFATQVVASNPTGNLIPMPTTNTTGQNFIGIIAQPISATDSDYATAGKLKGYWVPKTRSCEAFFLVGNGTNSAAQVGRVCPFHTDSKSLNVGANGAGARITSYISSTRGTCAFDVAIAVTA
jgi:hypothetical protein